MCIIVAIFPLDYIAVIRLISVIVFDSSSPAPSQMSLGVLRLTINDTSARRQPQPPPPPPPTTSADNAAHLERKEDAAQSNTTHIHMPQTPQMPPTLTIRMPQLPTIVSTGVRHVTETPPYVSSVYQPPNIITNQVGAQRCVNQCHVIDPHPQPSSSSPIWPHPAPSVPIDGHRRRSSHVNAHPDTSTPVHAHSNPIHAHPHLQCSSTLIHAPLPSHPLPSTPIHLSHLFYTPLSISCPSTSKRAHLRCIHAHL